MLSHWHRQGKIFASHRYASFGKLDQRCNKNKTGYHHKIKLKQRPLCLIKLWLNNDFAFFGRSFLLYLFIIKNVCCWCISNTFLSLFYVKIIDIKQNNKRSIIHLCYETHVKCTSFKFIDSSKSRLLGPSEQTLCSNGTEMHLKMCFFRYWNETRSSFPLAFFSCRFIRWKVWRERKLPCLFVSCALWKTCGLWLISPSISDFFPL